MYRTKLSLSVGRALLRPQYETELTIQDRTPGLFVADLLEHFDGVFPDLLEKKKVQADRVTPMPTRKRTALIDQRISRSRLSEDVNPQELLQQQQALQHPASASRATHSSIDLGPPMPVTETPGPVPQPVPVPVAGEHERHPSDHSNASFASPAATIPPTIPPVQPPVQAPSQAPHVQPAPPVQAQRRDSTGSDDFEEPFIPPVEDNAKVLPPTPIVPSDGTRSITPNNGTGHASPGSPARAYDEEPVSGTVGAGTLKRNTSSEASRLRGPRGARGPRTGHQTRGSVSQLAAQFETK